MRLGTVLTATNTNPLYIDFIPYFIRAWKKLYPNINIVIVLVADAIPESYNEYAEYIRLFPPINGVSTIFTSQYIRNLYPAIIDSPDGVLITDMDMIPMSRTYYSAPISNISDDKFVYYRANVCMYDKQLAMCYNIATPNIWSNIMDIKSEDDIKTRLVSIFSSFKNYHGTTKESYWCKDQCDLYSYVMNWNKTTGNLVLLNDSQTGFKRLCRSQVNTLSPNNRLHIKQGLYTDYHSHRPAKTHSDIINTVIGLL